MYGVDINEKRDEPIMGRGRYRVTGQKIGEMELSVLLSRNAKQSILLMGTLGHHACVGLLLWICPYLAFPDRLFPN